MLPALAGAAGALLFCLVTYHDWLDGPRVPYLLGLAVAAGTALLAGFAGSVPPWWSLLLVVAVLLPAPAVHVARFANRHMAVTRELGRLVEYGSVLEPTVQGQASFRPEGDALALHVPAGSIGFLEVRRPDRDLNRWDVPRALYAPSSPQGHELLAWTAEVVPDGHFFVLVDTGQLQVQLQFVGVQAMLQATSAATANGRPTATQTVPVPALDGYRQWTLIRGDGQIALRLDGRDVLALPDSGPFRFLRLGETRTDGEHGGTLRLRALRYARTS